MSVPIESRSYNYVWTFHWLLNFARCEIFTDIFFKGTCEQHIELNSTLNYLDIVLFLV